MKISLQIDSGIIESHQQLGIWVLLQVHNVDVEDVVKDWSGVGEGNLFISSLVSPSLVSNGIVQHLSKCIILNDQSFTVRLSIDDVNIHLSSRSVHFYLSSDDSLIQDSFLSILLLVDYLSLDYSILIGVR